MRPKISVICIILIDLSAFLIFIGESNLNNTNEDNLEILLNTRKGRNRNVLEELEMYRHYQEKF